MSREFCWKCVLAKSMCYCADIRSADMGSAALPYSFIILTHPIEYRRRIATGRMAHLCLPSSKMFVAESYTHHKELNALINDPKKKCLLLHPQSPSIVLNDLDVAQKRAIFAEPDREALIIVVDGTWATARKTLRLSPNLTALPRICFRPGQASNFRVRKQPRPEYVSTIEAIHETAEQLTDLHPQLALQRPHDRLLEVFDAFVERQLNYVSESRTSARPSRYRVAARMKEAALGIEATERAIRGPMTET